jgi:DNA polymerase phi
MLRQLFGQDTSTVEDANFDVASIIKMVEEKTKVEGNVPGRVGSRSSSLLQLT